MQGVSSSPAAGLCLGAHHQALCWLHLADTHLCPRERMEGRLSRTTTKPAPMAIPWSGPKNVPHQPKENEHVHTGTQTAAVCSTDSCWCNLLLQEGAATLFPEPCSTRAPTQWLILLSCWKTPTHLSFSSALQKHLKSQPLKPAQKQIVFMAETRSKTQEIRALCGSRRQQQLIQLQPKAQPS